jgi:hypothetical protein
MTLDVRPSSAPRSPQVARIPISTLDQRSSSPTIHEVREPVVTVEDVRSLAMSLPRTTEALVRDRVKFRVGRIVYIAFSRDETVMGFAFPKDEREALVRSEPDKFIMPGASDLRYHWVEVRLNALDVLEMRELVLDAWRMVVPKSVAAAYDDP